MTFVRSKRNMRLTSFFCVMLLASLSPIAARQNSPKPGSIEGVVLNSNSGARLADVRVTASSTTETFSRSVTTDAEGRFVVQSLPAGRYLLTANRTLFSSPRKNAPALPLALAPGEVLRDIQIALLPTGVISGRVLDDKRQAVRAVRVEALRREYRSGVLAWVASTQGTTNDRGEYRLFNLQPGTYIVRAVPPTAGPVKAEVYYPSGFEVQSAVTIPIAPGSESGGTDVMFRKNVEGDVQLRLPGLAADATAYFYLLPRNRAFSDSLAVKPDSLPDKVFRFTNVPSGAYDLFVTATSSIDQQRTVTHTARLSFDADARNLDLGAVDLQPNFLLSGRFLAAEGLTVPVDPTKLVLTLRPAEIFAPLTTTVRGTPTRGIGVDGSFAISLAAASKFNIALTGLPPEAYLVAAKADGRDILDTGLDMSLHPERLELWISGASSVGSVAGVVRDARGDLVPFASVILVPRPERRSNPSAFKTATTDQHGEFTFRAVIPDDYAAFAWDDLEPGIYQNPEFLKEVEARGERIKVERGAVVSVVIRALSVPW